MKIGLVDFLELGDFDVNKPTKVVRHQDSRNSIEMLRQNNWLEQYQSYQKNPVFHKADQVVSFYGLSGTRAGFYGVYKVLERVPASQGEPVPIGQIWGQDCKFFYNLQRDNRFDDFRDRLIIDWGKGTINWQQWLSRSANKEVLEVLSPGRKLPPFVDYLKFTLSFRQLQELFSNEEAHRDWKNPLSAVAGIYLILAEASGDMYVGSACGTRGIWGRWRAYASGKDSGHGGNDLLNKLTANDPNYPTRFRFSVLQILPISTTEKEVVQWEQLYKEKLGSKATGLNSN